MTPLLLTLVLFVAAYAWTLDAILAWRRETRSAEIRERIESYLAVGR